MAVPTNPPQKNKLKTESPYNPSILLLDVYPKKKKKRKKKIKSRDSKRYL